MIILLLQLIPMINSFSQNDSVAPGCIPQGALFSRTRDGEGRYVDIAMADCAVSLLQTSLPMASNGDHAPGAITAPLRIHERGKTPPKTRVRNIIIC